MTFQERSFILRQKRHLMRLQRTGGESDLQNRIETYCATYLSHKKHDLISSPRKAGSNSPCPSPAFPRRIGCNGLKLYSRLIWQHHDIEGEICLTAAHTDRTILSDFEKLDDSVAREDSRRE